MEVLVEILVAVLSMVVLSVAFRVLFKLNGGGVCSFDKQVNFDELDDDSKSKRHTYDFLSYDLVSRANPTNIHHNDD